MFSIKLFYETRPNADKNFHKIIILKCGNISGHMMYREKCLSEYYSLSTKTQEIVKLEFESSSSTAVQTGADTISPCFLR